MPYDETLAADPELPPAPKHPQFEGFAPLQSNTTYCPNQFFDVVLPHFARGVVRLVGYVIYRTFAWSDRDGRPIGEQHKVSYRELIEEAGISRGALSEVIDEALPFGAQVQSALCRETVVSRPAPVLSHAPLRRQQPALLQTMQPLKQGSVIHGDTSRRSLFEPGGYLECMHGCP